MTEINNSQNQVDKAITNIQQTGDILPAIYHSQWYLRECKCGHNLQRKHMRSFRQGINIMMERAKSATCLTAAKLFRLNYATFVTVRDSKIGKRRRRRKLRKLFI